MEDLVYKVDKNQVIKLSLVGLGFLLIGMICLINGNGFFMFIGLVITLAAFYFVFATIRNATFDVEVLTLTNMGFDDNSSEMSVGFIPWEAVEDISAIKIGGRFTKPIISVKIASEYLDALDITTKKLSKVNNAMGFGEVNISLQLLKESHIEVLETMVNYLNEFRSKKVRENY